MSDRAAPTLELFFDYSSPFAYLASTQADLTRQYHRQLLCRMLGIIFFNDCHSQNTYAVPFVWLLALALHGGGYKSKPIPERF